MIIHKTQNMMDKNKFKNNQLSRIELKREKFKKHWITMKKFYKIRALLIKTVIYNTNKQFQIMKVPIKRCMKNKAIMQIKSNKNRIKRKLKIIKLRETIFSKMIIQINFL